MPKKIEINAMPEGCKLYYKDINRQIRKAIADGHDYIILKNVMGQRYIGAGLKGDYTIEIFGDAGLDLGVFSEGLTYIVHGSSEYLLGNTLNGGEIVVYGDSWDITGMGARGGNIFVMSNGGSRIGIHMKEFGDRKPVICYGGTVKQYCGEYMAGGVIVVLGLDFKDAIKDPKKPIDKNNIDGTKVKNIDGAIVQSDLAGGIHGGAVYVRGHQVPDELLGVYAVKEEIQKEDKTILEPIIKRFCELFNVDTDFIWEKGFTKISPFSSRPFGKHYTTTPI
jgi:glutamate synthase domain-containing protein 3